MCGIGLSKAGGLAVVACLIAPCSASAGIVVVGGSPPPDVAYITPHEGKPGDVVTINGLNLEGATAVDFGSAPASFTVRNSLWIEATVPEGSGAVEVSVMTPAGRSEGAGVGQRFTYVAPPAPVPALSAPITPPPSSGVVATSGLTSAPPPPSHPASHAADGCVVPDLRGKTVRTARRALRGGHCTLGRVIKPRRGRGALVVRSQSRTPGEQAVLDTAVTVRLGKAVHRR